MTKHYATLIFYSWTSKEEDTAAVKRIQKFLRHEHLVIEGDRYECNTYKYVLPEKLRQMSEPFSDSQDALNQFEHRYFVTLSKRDPTKLHALVSLLQAYASYIGIHSRLFSWESKE